MSQRILVVDDEESILRTLEGVLHDEGYEVVVAGSGEEAEEKAEAEDPDLVLLDVWLPGQDGLVTLANLRTRFPCLPVLMMSGHGSIETAVKATRLGACDFIEKPLNLDRLLLALESALCARAKAAEAADEGLGLREARRAFEHRHLVRCLEVSAWNVPRAAERLGLDPSTLSEKMRELGIEVPTLARPRPGEHPERR